MSENWVSSISNFADEFFTTQKQKTVTLGVRKYRETALDAYWKRAWNNKHETISVKTALDTKYESKMQFFFFTGFLSITFHLRKTIFCFLTVLQDQLLGQPITNSTYWSSGPSQRSWVPCSLCKLCLAGVEFTNLNTD